MNLSLRRALSLGLVSLLVAVAGHGGGETTGGAATLTADSYIAHIKYLASDSLQGRRPGSPGMARAEVYIANHFAQLGLRPGGEDDSYFQSFELRRQKRFEPASASLKIAGLDRTLACETDWMPLSFSATGSVTDAPIAFIGYGIDAHKKEDDKPKDDKSDGAAKADEPKTDEPKPDETAKEATPEAEEEYSDYDGFEAKGKVLLMLRHEPKSENPDAKIGGKAPSTHATFATKVSTAQKFGAKAILLVNPPNRADADGKPIEDRLMSWDENAGVNSKIPFIQITQATADAILAAAKLPDLKALQANLDSQRKGASADLPELKVTLDPGVGYLKARNVVSILDGEGAADEYVVVGGHHDHLGRSTPRQGFGRGSGDPEIHNGADDNASGTAGVLELARVIASGPKPRRSVIFMTFSAEEMGLLGSAHWVAHPTVPLEKVKAMINLDMIGRFGQDKFEMYGVDSATEFEDLVRTAAEKFDVHYKGQPAGRMGFGDSDHSSFYRKGIPVLFAFTGLHDQYHKPEDDWERIDATGAAHCLEFMKFLTLACANMVEGPTRPTKAEKAPQGESETSKPADAPALEAAKAEKQDKPEKPEEDQAAAPQPMMPMPTVRLGVAPAYGDDGAGLLIDRVVSGGLAEKAGVKDGDRILKIGGSEIDGIETYMATMRTFKDGDEIELLIERKGEKLTIKLKAVAARAERPRPS